MKITIEQSGKTTVSVIELPSSDKAVRILQHNAALDGLQLLLNALVPSGALKTNEHAVNAVKTAVETAINGIKDKFD